VDARRSSPDEAEPFWYPHERGDDLEQDPLGGYPAPGPGTAAQPPAGHHREPSYRDQGYGDQGYTDHGYGDQGYRDEGYADQGYGGRGYEEPYRALEARAASAPPGYMDPPVLGPRSGQPLPPMPMPPPSMPPPSMSPPSMPPPPSVPPPSAPAPDPGAPVATATATANVRPVNVTPDPVTITSGAGAPANAAPGATGELPPDEVGQQRHHATPLDFSALRRAPGAPAPADSPGSVYRSRRPGLAALLIIMTIVFELPAFRVFASSAAAARVDANGTLASMFVIAGVPLFALGLYGLIGGTAAAPGQGGRAWLRPPLAYLPIGLLLFLAAAIAA
jgi:hypothetical protein